METTVSWDKLLHEYYGVYMPKGRPELWLQLIREAPPSGCGSHTTESEIAEAIKWVRTKKSADRDDTKINMDLNTLIIWVRWYRKSKRNDNDGLGEVVQSKCGVCDNGWVLCWLNLPANPTYADFGPQSGQVVVPCLCNEGRRVFGITKDYQGINQDEDRKLRDMASLGAQQVGLMREVQRREVEAMLKPPAAPVQGCTPKMGKGDEDIPAFLDEVPEDEPETAGVPF